jgi:PKD repeat protein
MKCLMNKISLTLVVYIILVLAAANPGRAQTYFETHIIDNHTYGTCSLEAPDIDGDGDLDVLAAANEDHDVIWWRNDGGEPVAWSKFTIGQNVFEAHSAYAADLDGDDDLDVIATAYRYSQVYWWRNDGGDPIEWTRFTISNTFNAGHEVYASDLDNDGDNDVLGASSNLNRISWWRNDGGDPIIWSEQVIDGDVGLAKSVRTADIDGDSLMDVIGASLGDNDVIWYRNNGGDPIVWTEFLIDGDFWGAHRVQAIDMDYDGDYDIVGTACLGHQIAWWRNDGGEPVSWTKQIVGEGIINACVAMAADLDNDDDLDIAGTGQASDEVSWWRNDGGEPITWTKSTIDNFDRVWPLYIADLNNDNNLDIIAGSSQLGTGEVKWYDNLGGVYVIPDFSADPPTGHYPLEVYFVDLTVASPQANYWAWDFNGDGLTDSYERFPVWTYNEAGAYTVSLQAANDSLSRSRTRDNYIRVFSGQSALEFDGQNSFAQCPASQTLNITDALTIEAWIKPYGWGENANQGFGKIVDKEKFAFFVFGSGSINDHSVVLQLVDEGGNMSLIYTPVNSIQLHAWQHVAASYDGNGEVKLYVNGAEQFIEQTSPPAGSIQDNSDIDLMIGNSAGRSHTFDGIIDEVRIWSIVRSGAEIQGSMNNYIDGGAAGLSGNWRLDEGNGDIIFDSSVNSNDGAAVDIGWVEGNTLNPVSIDEHSLTETPDRILLSGAYPNPFNAQTMIHYYLPGQSEISIDIFDILGRKVDNIRSGIKPAGHHKVFWNAEEFASGIYFYRLQANDYSETRKMVLMK